MALEIERRFLVRGNEWRRYVTWEADLEQAYLASGPTGLVLRVRICRGGVSTDGQAAAAAAWLTIKAPSEGAGTMDPPAGMGAHTRLEFEYPIPAPDAETMVRLSDRRIRKRRHGLDMVGGDWVLDIFADANAPLVLAEVELAAADQVVWVPDWCWLEVTDRRDLSNAALADRPLQSWSPLERQALFGGAEGEGLCAV